MNTKLFNEKTGLWFRTGVNFNEPCFSKASILEPQQAAVVKASFLNVCQHSVGALMGGELPECNCGQCDTPSTLWMDAAYSNRI
jgi:hypothetical protein